MSDDEWSKIAAKLAMCRAEHQALDQYIAHLAKAPLIDYAIVKRLKIRKLRLKDEIARLEQTLPPDDIA